LGRGRSGVQGKSLRNKQDEAGRSDDGEGGGRRYSREKRISE
jgi:hypothetical protein